MSAGARLVNVYLEGQGDVFSLKGAGASANDVIVKGTTNALACYLGGGNTLTNSLCWAATGAGAAAATDGSNTFRNDTLVGGSQAAIQGMARNGPFPIPTCNCTAATDTLRNVIARSAPGGHDILASSDGTATMTFDVTFSNYATTFKGQTPSKDFINGDATDQTAAPVFVNAAAGNFREKAGSPTIDKGVNAAANGTADFDGDPRTVNGRTDMGADEFVPAPTAVTGVATGISKSGATLNGAVNPHTRPTSYYFQWGSSKAYGHFTATKSAGNGTIDVPVSAKVSGLAAGKTYYFRLVATSSAGTTQGKDAIFKTLSSPPPKKSHFSGAFVAKGSAKVQNGDAGVRIACPKNAAAPPGGGAKTCTGILTLKSAKKVQTSTGKRRIRLGEVSFSILAGKKATVLVPISSDGQNALAKTGKLKAKAKVVSQDGAGTQRTRTRSILLKLKK